MKNFLKYVRTIIISSIVRFSGTARYIPELEWSKTSLVFNICRFIEQIIGRKYGIRLECSTLFENGIYEQQFHSLESLLIFTEHCIRSKFKLPKLVFVRVPILSFAGNSVEHFTQNRSPYLFAIAFEGAGSGGTPGSGTTSFSVTSGGTERYLLFGAYYSNNSGITTPSYNSVSLSSIVSTGSGSVDMRAWALINPSTGSNTLGNFGDSATKSGAAASYSGVSQDTPYPDTSSNFQSSLPDPIAVTVTASNSDNWIFLFMGCQQSPSPTASGYTSRASDSRDGAAAVALDSAGTVSSGDNVISVSHSRSGATGGLIAVAIQPPVVTSTANFFQVM